MRYPLDKKETSFPFGATPYPLLIINPDGTTFGYRHHGHDDPKPEGTRVYAPETITINQAGDAGSAGIMIIGITADRRWRFLHLSRLNVRVGQKVQEGGLIGWTGNTGFSTGPHLHFDLVINGKYSDPVKYIEENDMTKPSRSVIIQSYIAHTGKAPNDTQIEGWLNTKRDTNYFINTLWKSPAGKKWRSQISDSSKTIKTLEAQVTWRGRVINNLKGALTSIKETAENALIFPGGKK